MAQPLPPAARQPRSARQTEEQGPLASPARSAAIIAVLGVLVMTVSVGAISAALRIR